MFVLKTLVTLACEIMRHAQTWFGSVYDGIDPIHYCTSTIYTIMYLYSQEDDFFWWKTNKLAKKKANLRSKEERRPVDKFSQI